MYKPRERLVHFLRDRHILNRSSYTPSPEEIEILALDVGFVPPQSPHQWTLDELISNYLEKIDRLIFFEGKNGGYPRGYLGPHFRTPWTSPQKDWLSDSSNRKAVRELRESLQLTSSLKFPEALDSAYRSLSSNSQIYVIKADKGGVTVLLNRTDYICEAQRQLSDISTYQLIPPTEIPATLALLQDCKWRWTSCLHHFKYITDREKILIEESESSIPIIYFLPKIHKAVNPSSGTFPGRPIVATYSCHLHWFDKYITEITNPLQKLIPHSLIDTLDLLQKLQSFERPLPDNLRIFSADVNSLYPSIRWTPGIAAATEVYSKFYHILVEKALRDNRLRPPTPGLFASMLHDILSNSFMCFQTGETYRQLTGTAMGMCISVFFAKCYMYKMISGIILNPPLHLRALEIFIDDLFVMTTGSDDEITSLMESITNDHITYTCDQPGTSTNMLDLTIYIELGRLWTKPYTKPTSSPFYLHAGSMHSQATINSIPYAQLLRLKRNSTFVSDSVAPTEKLLKTLGLRGYNPEILSTAYTRICRIPQDSLVQRGKRSDRDTRYKTSDRFGRSIKLVIPFTWSLNPGRIKRALRRVHTSVSDYIDKHSQTNPLRLVTSEMIFCNLPNLNSGFTPQYKLGDRVV